MTMQIIDKDGNKTKERMKSYFYISEELGERDKFCEIIDENGNAYLDLRVNYNYYLASDKHEESCYQRIR